MTNRWGYKMGDRDLVVYRDTREQAAAVFGVDGEEAKKIEPLPSLTEESRRAAKIEDRRKAPGG